MLRHYLSLAVRNVGRTKSYTAISIAGLAMGFAAAILIALYVHDELTYETWIPDHDRIYQVSAVGPRPIISGVAPSDLGQWLASDYPQFEAVTRLFQDKGRFGQGDRQFVEKITWADANAFDVFHFPIVSGSLDGALKEPGNLVLTRSVAEKYFGKSSAVGKRLLYNGEHEMVVTAVIEDLPSNSHLSISMIGAGQTEYSPAAEQDRNPMRAFGSKLWNSQTYFLLRPHEPIEPIRAGIATLLDRHAPLPGARKASDNWPLVVRPIRKIHLGPRTIDAGDNESLGGAVGIAAIGFLIMLAASINFVNLFTALGARRAVGIGVRKALGARPRDLFVQFMSESFLYVGVAALLGLAVAAAALRPLDAFLLRTIEFSVLLDPSFVAGALALLFMVALLAGLYPAILLSSLRPMTVTKAPTVGNRQAGVRQTLVALQFAILIALLIATAVTYQQTAFGMREALRSNTHPIVLLDGKCTESLRNEIRKAPGVLDTACAQGLPQLGSDLMSPINRRDAEPFGVRYLSVGFGFFELYGLRAVAGRFFSPELGTDQSPPDNVWTAPESLVINEAAARQLGFASPADAVGETVTFMHVFRLPVTMAPRHDAKIIGVVEDFQMGPVRREITPAAFFVDPAQAQVLSIKLDGRAVPESLAAIDRISTEFGESGPPQRRFFEDSVQRMYIDLQRQGELFSIFAGVAVLIAVLGLIGLAAHAAVSRTKEIGIRKALGGHRWTIVGLLLWQFAKPVLLANLIAWPAAYYAMHVWLEGFARRVDLEWWMFIAATLVTLVVALASVMVHSWMMAGVRPVEALRYE